MEKNTSRLKSAAQRLAAAALAAAVRTASACYRFRSSCRFRIVPSAAWFGDASTFFKTCSGIGRGATVPAIKIPFQAAGKQLALLLRPAATIVLTVSTALAVGSCFQFDNPADPQSSAYNYPSDLKGETFGTPYPVITTVAGNGTAGYGGDDGPATSAQLDAPRGVAVDFSGNIYIADTQNDRIREVSTSGTITTVAGTGTAGYSGDDGPATSAQLDGPQGVAADSSGNIYIADTQNDRIREVSASGTITTVAGNGTIGYGGDSGPATSAEMFDPCGVAVDSSRTIYIADTNNDRIREVSASGTITTVAGTGTAGYSGDDGPAASAELNVPQDVAVDSSGNIYIADTQNDRIREVSASGTITTVAGTGTAGYGGDGGPAASAELNVPQGVAVDSSGNIYIADTQNDRIREVGTSGTITTVAGNGVQGYAGDGSAASSAELNEPFSVKINSSGTVYIDDNGNNRVRALNN